MKFKTKDQKDVTVIELKDNVMGGPDASELNQELNKLLEAGKRKFVINLSEVKFMNSSGLGMMIGTLTSVRNAGGELRLAAATKKIETLLTVTKLTTIFQRFDTVKDAVESFKQQR
jgi:anti-sigma B factor antagonist